MASFSAQQELLDRYFDARTMMKQFTCKESSFREDTMIHIFPLLNKTFSMDAVKGEVLIQMSIGLYFPYTLPACEHFRDFIVGGPTDECIAEVEKWRTKAPDAIDINYAVEVASEHQANGEPGTEKADTLRTNIKKVLKYDVMQRNPFHPVVLPPADCLLLAHCLECHVTSKEAFCIALKNVSLLLKKGGHLIIIACLGETYFLVGKFKWPHLSIEAEFVRKALEDNGYVIEDLHVLPRTCRRLYEMGDYHSFIYAFARKVVDTPSSDDPHLIDLQTQEEADTSPLT
ncbi:nicotinamide N-methyltransferase-like [Lissotriton helveticus]